MLEEKTVNPKNSPDNLSIIRRLYEVFGQKDWDAFRGLCADDIVWVQNEGFPGGGTHHGADAIIENVFKGFKNEWHGWSYDIDEYLDAGHAVVVLGSYRGTHVTTGKSMTAAAAHVYDLRDGRITRFRQYTDTAMLIRAMTE